MVSKEGSSVKVAVYISQWSVGKGSSAKVAVYTSQESVRKGSSVKVAGVYLNG